MWSTGFYYISLTEPWRQTTARQEGLFRILLQEWRLEFMAWAVLGTMEEEGFRNQCGGCENRIRLTGLGLSCDKKKKIKVDFWVLGKSNGYRKLGFISNGDIKWLIKFLNPELRGKEKYGQKILTRTSLAKTLNESHGPKKRMETKRGDLSLSSKALYFCEPDEKESAMKTEAANSDTGGKPGDLNVMPHNGKSL